MDLKFTVHNGFVAWMLRSHPFCHHWHYSLTLAPWNLIRTYALELKRYTIC